MAGALPLAPANLFRTRRERRHSVKWKSGAAGDSFFRIRPRGPTLCNSWHAPLLSGSHYRGRSESSHLGTLVTSSSPVSPHEIVSF